MHQDRRKLASTSIECLVSCDSEYCCVGVCLIFLCPAASSTHGTDFLSQGDHFADHISANEVFRHSGPLSVGFLLLRDLSSGDRNGSAPGYLLCLSSSINK